MAWRRWLSNYDGTIYSRYATESGDAGLDSTFGEVMGTNGTGGFDSDTVLIGPDDFKVNGPWPHPCQGMQGTDSFYPYVGREEPFNEGPMAVDSIRFVRSTVRCTPLGVHRTCTVRAASPTESREGEATLTRV